MVIKRRRNKNDDDNNNNHNTYYYYYCYFIPQNLSQADYWNVVIQKNVGLNCVLFCDAVSIIDYTVAG